MEVLKSLEAKSKNAKLTEEEKKEARDILNKLSSNIQGEQFEQGKKEARDILNKLPSNTQGEQFEQGKYDLQAEFPFGQNWNRNSPYAGTEVNKIKWEYKNFNSKGGIQQFLAQPTIDRDGTIYVGNQNGKLYAFNKDGSIKWIKDGMGSMDASPIMGEDGTIYFSGAKGQLIALNPDGSIKWQINKEGFYARETPIIGSDGTIYVRNIKEYRLEAYNPDGSVKWVSNKMIQLFYSTNTMRISKDGTIYNVVQRESESVIYAHDKNGKQLWTKTLKGHHRGFNLGLNGELLLNGQLGSSQNDTVIILDKDGNLIKQWTQVPKSMYGTHATPTIYSKDGTIYIGGNDGLYAYNSDYTLKWKYSTERGVSSTTIDKNGVIYFKSSTELYAVNPDGTLKWKLPHSYASGANDSITIDKDGNLYTVGWAHVKGNKGGGYTDTYYSIMAIGDSYADNVCTKESTFMEVLKSLEAKIKNAKFTEEEKKEALEILNKISNNLDKKDN
ncbi:PQQ-like beta-propeller repeat protein [Bacillus cereus]